MAKKEIQHITSITKQPAEKLLPIYFFCGEDQYTIDRFVELIEKKISNQIQSDFDKEVFSADKNQSLSQILDLALSFPFGSGKKLFIVKYFEKFNDKKELVNYAKNPPDFTVIVITQTGKISDVSKEPYSILWEKNFLFEAKPVSSLELINWSIKTAMKLGFELADEYAEAVIEIVGVDKNLLEMQLQKFADFLKDKTELTFDDIKKLTSPTKEYSIFDLQDALGRGEKAMALEIGFNLLDAGVEMVFIVNMLGKYILTVAQIVDLNKQKISDYEAAKLAGVNYFYYINCKKAFFLMSDDKLYNASKALLNADIATKTTAADPKTVLQILISELLGEAVTSNFII